MRFTEKGYRSLIKMVTFRIIATTTTMLFVYIFVGKISIAVTIGIIETVAKMIIYYLHERVWDKVNMGRSPIEEKTFVLWFTGLPCSGKTTLADKAYDSLKKLDKKVEKLDGDTIRDIFPQTGFSKDERNAHVKRIGYLASMLEKNGTIVIASFVSPYKEAREFVREQCKNFIEIYVSTPSEECEKRDVKGMYKKARSGEIKNFTGISDPYECPENPEIVIDTTNESIEESMDKIFNYESSRKN